MKTTGEKWTHPCELLIQGHIKENKMKIKNNVFFIHSHQQDTLVELIFLYRSNALKNNVYAYIE